MDADLKIFLPVIGYHALALLCGLAIVFMGYRLFRVGIFGNTDLTAEARGAQITLKAAAPGTLFAIFGAIVMFAALWRGLSLTESRSDTAHWVQVAGQVPAPGPAFRSTAQRDSVLSKVLRGSRLDSAESRAFVVWCMGGAGAGLDSVTSHRLARACEDAMEKFAAGDSASQTFLRRSGHFPSRSTATGLAETGSQDGC